MLALKAKKAIALKFTLLVFFSAFKIVALHFNMVIHN